ncbi:Glutathione S-transferase 2 [Knufia obscura]|uniref:Glutathione S-transferase 2 n=2 Tax=Knufia TaxID=430999 RepID=A0AAN8I7T8_9EURO|nr:Glutathione S-transferase 2 [Knufia obscura]KAK5956404.1 Glutathione S-transferase 2 [Knufia fluminis]
MSTSNRPNITLYTDSTPNGIKASIALEELSLPYKTEHINISTNKQKEPWFLEINPNGRIPAMTDTHSTGQQIRLFEGGSILQYLADEYDTDHKISFPRGSREYYECNNWLFWQHGGLGPMQGQANHFYRYAPEKIQYGIDRYINESRRLYGVLDKHLKDSKSGFIVGDHISIADITTIGWVIFAGWAGVNIDEFPNVKKWEEMMSAREGVSKGSAVPKPLKIKEMLAKSPEEADAYAKNSSKWIMQGMNDDKKKE